MWDHLAIINEVKRAVWVTAENIEHNVISLAEGEYMVVEQAETRKLWSI